MEAQAEASSRDLLQRFAGSTSLSDRPEKTPPEAVAGGEIELSLGLSLGGCFSSEPREKNRLIRSSSISTFCMFTSKDENFPAPAAPLARTCSLPAVGAGEEYRKRKELQSLKRLEAKRKRSEKRNSSKLDQLSGCPWFPGSTQFGSPGLPGSGRAASRLPLSQGSIGSQGSSSSGGASEFDRPQIQGLDISRISNFSETKSLSLPDHSNHKVSANKDLLKKCGRRGSEMEEMERSMMEEMPCVSTRGDGPNGRRIEGFLYKYRRGEEVRIVCVCHGSFLTPAEFVKHAGGGDVDHPLRHIVVNPSSAFL